MQTNSNAKKDAHLVKMLVVGDQDVGKSQMQLRFNGDPYVEGYHGSLGYIGLTRKTVNIEGRQVKLQIWDTVGEHRRLRSFDAHYLGTHSFLVLYDVSNRQSFAEIRNFLRLISKLARPAAASSIVLVGCKAELDRETKRQVSREEGQQLADELRCPFFEASAKENVNVTEVFMTAAQIGWRTKLAMLGTRPFLRGKTDHCYKGHALVKCTFAALPDDDCRFCSVCGDLVTNGSAGAQCPTCLFCLCPKCLPASEESRDLEKAFSDIWLSAENNTPDAQFFLGLCHANGEGMVQDLEGAAKWLERAAEQGHTHAQFALGKCYAEGRGVQKSQSKALAWFVRAADQQLAAARSKLQTMKVSEMHLSAFKGSIYSVKALLSSKASVDPIDTHRRRPLHLAAANGHVYVLQALLTARADIEATDQWQRTPVVLAAANGHADVVQALIQDRAEIAVKDQWSSSPLHLAAAGGHSDVSKALLYAKANTEAQNGLLQTPLHCAVLNSHIDVVRVLLGWNHAGSKANSRPHVNVSNVEAKDGNLHTPLHLAAETGNADIVNMLLDSGASVLASNTDERMPLHLAIIKGHFSVVIALLERGADVSAVCRDRETPLHCAALRGNSSIIEALLAANADVNARDASGRTPLHLVELPELEASNVTGFSTAAITALLDAGADVAALDDFLQTPLHLGAKRGGPIVQSLLDARADVAAKNKDGKTPVKMAVDYNRAVLERYKPVPDVELRLKEAEALRVKQTTMDLVIMQLGPAKKIPENAYVLDLHQLPSLCWILKALEHCIQSMFVGSLHTLSLAANNMKPIGATSVARLVQRLNALALTCFDVSHNPDLRTPGVMCLLEALPISIESLSLSDTGLEHSVFGDRLSHFSALSSLDISNNSKLSHTEICSLLRKLPASLKSLHVRNVELIGERNCVSQELLDCFSRFPDLISLDISENTRLSSSDICSILQTVPSSLRSLFMRSLDINSERMSLMESTLCRFKGLEKLDISSNDSKDDSFDPIVESVCRCLPGLKALDVSHVPSLFSLPDNLLDLKLLNHISVNGCKRLEYPPLRICQQGTAKIMEFLDGAQHADPLKKCKVVFLGNGRSGKTSLLRALAKLPLNADESSTQGVSAAHEFSDKLQPDFLRRMGGAPDLHFWDFAGQLEYSAVHEFFMSNRQAVYVIIFSTVDDREAQAHQVTYWLRTVLTRDVSCVRVVVVGTKLDKIEPRRLAQELEDIEGLMQRVVKSVIQKVAPSCCWSASVMFVTSNSTHPDFESRRVDLKGHIFDLSMEIFKGNHRMMRFPKEYIEISKEVKQVSKKLEKKSLMPLFELSDQKIVTAEYKNLHGAHTNSMKQEALKILGDVGELIYYEVKGSPWICAQPQLIASVIALFADPGRRIKSILSRGEIFSILDVFSHDEPTRQKLFDFLLALRVVMRASESVSLSHGSVSTETPAETGDSQYLIPLAFKGRPGFWSEVIDVKETRALRGVRFTAQRMISVASFVRVMSSLCSMPQHMWGCAFLSRVNDAASVFVRLADSRSAVDCIVIGPIGELSSSEIDSCLRSIAIKLDCDSHLLTFLCPQCCQSDVFLRSGNAHAFYFAPASASSNLSMHRMLNCSRYHSPTVESVKHGVSVNMTSTAVTALTEDAVRNELPWANVHTGTGIVLDRRLKLRAPSSSKADVRRLSMMARDDDSVCDTILDRDADTEAAGSRSTAPEKSPVFHGRLLPNSFFVLTQQLREDDLLEEASLQRLLDVVSDDTCLAKDVGVCVLRKVHGADANVEEFAVKIRYNVADMICGNQIDMIMSLSGASTVQKAEYVDAGMLSVTTAIPHQLATDSLVLLSASASHGGGILCRVAAFVSPIVLNLVRVENPDCPPPKCVGATLLPCQLSFGPNDNVLVMFKQVGNRVKFELFPGRSDVLEMAELTPADCSSTAIAACWRDIQNHWELMLGTEFKNYEMTRVTMFRNRSREQLFFQELHTLKARAASRSCETEWPVIADATPVEKEKRLQLQAQTMGHFNEFSEKFGLLPKHESKDVNLSIAWWGKWPSAYFNNAQHGFVNLPSHLKLDAGYFGEGFYLTQYPRYSDYYISGCSLSSRKMQDGHILLCYAALGRPYPVTQDPFDSPGYNTIGPCSLCGKLCGPQCGGADSHDCHYATVKMHADAKEFYPCPLRQQPDFDEIVLFKSERILPVAFVSFQRRRKTLLWLDDRPDKDDNLRIRSKIPGVQWFDEIDLMEQKGVTVKPGTTGREDGVSAVRISGVTGHYSSDINGVFTPTREMHCRRPVYCKGDSAEDKSACMWIEYDDARQQWQVKDTAHRGNGGWALASITTSRKLEECNKSGGIWKVAAVPYNPNAERLSYKLNEAATDKKLSPSPLTREDQVDLTLFTSVAALAKFLLDGAQTKFAKYPSSLFRIISNRRLFLGTVPVFCCSKSEFLCDGISALLSPNDEVVFEGDGLFGGVEAGVTYYLAAVRRSANKEFFSVSRAKGGEKIVLQPRALQEQDESARRPPMSVRASQRSLLHFLEASDVWQLSFPATCVFHGSCGGDELRALQGRRPNFVATSSEAECGAFVAFEPVVALQERH